ncbi:TadE/TadG family type IV pilus assembly protein [Vibrio sp. TRT 21S02]|uniref:TadE/TadG family type IV pilus assembly protein n=1 Tax=unclassified Vibrio TaxID=2614977 RepID=UPI003CF84813
MISYQRKEHGVAAVEFLITIPVLMVILVGITELGNALIRYNSINKLVQNGVRYATSDITGTATYDAIALPSEIKNMVVYGKPTASTGDTPLLSGLTTADVFVVHDAGYVTITVNHTYTPLLNIIPDSVNFNVPLNASAVMRTAP